MPEFKTIEDARAYGSKHCFHPVLKEVAGRHGTKYWVYDEYDMRR